MNSASIIKASFKDRPDSTNTISGSVLHNFIQNVRKSPKCLSVYCGSLDGDKTTVVLIAMWNEFDPTTLPDISLHSLTDYLRSPPVVHLCRFRSSLAELVSQRRNELDIDVVLVSGCEDSNATSQASIQDIVEQTVSKACSNAPCTFVSFHQGEILSTHPRNKGQVLIVKKAGQSFLEHCNQSVTAVEQLGYHMETLSTFLERERDHRSFVFRKEDQVESDSSDEESEICLLDHAAWKRRPQFVTGPKRPEILKWGEYKAHERTSNAGRPLDMAAELKKLVESNIARLRKAREELDQRAHKVNSNL